MLPRCVTRGHRRSESDKQRNAYAYETLLGYLFTVFSYPLSRARAEFEARTGAEDAAEAEARPRDRHADARRAGAP